MATLSGYSSMNMHPEKSHSKDVNFSKDMYYAKMTMLAMILQLHDYNLSLS